MPDDEATSSVCEGCPGRCCTRRFGFTAVSLTEEEAVDPLFAPYVRRTSWMLPEITDTNPEGACMFLKEGRCSIYERRPAACREFYCWSHNDRKVQRLVAGWPELHRHIANKAAPDSRMHIDKIVIYLRNLDADAFLAFFKKDQQLENSQWDLKVHSDNSMKFTATNLKALGEPRDIFTMAIPLYGYHTGSGNEFLPPQCFATDGQKDHRFHDADFKGRVIVTVNEHGVLQSERETREFADLQREVRWIVTAGRKEIESQQQGTYGLPGFAVIERKQTNGRRLTKLEKFILAYDPFRVDSESLEFRRKLSEALDAELEKLREQMRADFEKSVVRFRDEDIVAAGPHTEGSKLEGTDHTVCSSAGDGGELDIFEVKPFVVGASGKLTSLTSRKLEDRLGGATKVLEESRHENQSIPLTDRIQQDMAEQNANEELEHLDRRMRRVFAPPIPELNVTFDGVTWTNDQLISQMATLYASFATLSNIGGGVDKRQLRLAIGTALSRLWEKITGQTCLPDHPFDFSMRISDFINDPERLSKEAEASEVTVWAALFFEHAHHWSLHRRDAQQKLATLAQPG